MFTNEFIAGNLEVARRMAARADQPLRASGEPASHQAIILETLLLCRSIAQPQRAGVAQGEVARLGLPVWRGGPLTG